jgi:hypothetical protein
MVYKHGRRVIHFSNHALDRWWDRCKANDVHGRKDALDLLRERLGYAAWSRSLPAWSRTSLWNRARAEGFLALDENSGFIINRNDVTRDRVAVTYIENVVVNPDSFVPISGRSRK